jgi:hypothetical protein
MLQRLAMCDLPPREILLDRSMVVRDSCGAKRRTGVEEGVVRD